ncbi:hypothetical protein JCM18909_3924 [Cutibacterium acnes JCM 18909]|nr:hypothetical protein JCM18909_3924 [Cutibacterium acnes JCM 18909]
MPAGTHHRSRARRALEQKQTSMSQQGTLQDLHILAPVMTQVDDKAGGKSLQLA